jgi:hypothetical protein
MSPTFETSANHSVTDLFSLNSPRKGDFNMTTKILCVVLMVLAGISTIAGALIRALRKSIRTASSFRAQGYRTGSMAAMIRPWPMAAAGLFIAATATAIPTVAVAGSTTATAYAGGWSARPTQTKGDNQTWRFSTPTGAEAIGWSSGPSELDNTAVWQRKQYGPEFKFALPGGILTGRTFTGFTNTDGPNAPGLSIATQSGSGSSTVPATGRIIASWTVTAGGTLGAPKLTAPGYETTASAYDPWPITAAQLAATGVAGSAYNLFIPVGLQSGHFSAKGDITLDASYDTASATMSLLHVDVNAQQAILTGDSQAKYFVLSSMDESPADITSSSLTASQLQEILQKDVKDNSISSPLYVGIELDNLTAPTTSMADGSLAEIHVDSSVSDAAGAVPEPPALVLAGIACAILVAYRVARPRVTPARAASL